MHRLLRINDAEFKTLTDFILDNYGINLTKKRVLIEGRLGNMLNERGFDSYTEYLNVCFSDTTGKELEQLMIKLTTNHTFFMREPEHYKFLSETALPIIKSENRDSRCMRIWSAGCSSGEEAYTTAMLISEFLKTEKPQWDTRILATDISLKILAGAQAGIYKKSSTANLPEYWIKKYFTDYDNESLKVNDDLRKEVIFKRFNLMDEIPFKKAPFDIIFCRNVMIYFTKETKTALLKRFFEVLRPGGYLFIGHSESIPRNEAVLRDKSKAMGDCLGYEYIKPAIYRKPIA